MPYMDAMGLHYAPLRQAWTVSFVKNNSVCQDKVHTRWVPTGYVWSKKILIWLVVWTQFEFFVGQIGSFSQVKVKIKNVWVATTQFLMAF